MGATILKVFGEESLELKRYRSASSWGRPVGGINKAAIDAQLEEKFDEMLSSIRGWLDALVSQIERFGIDTTPTQVSANEATASELMSEDRKFPRRYAFTSPAFLAERLWSLITRLYKIAVDHKILSSVAAILGSIASAVGILRGLGVL